MLSHSSSGSTWLATAAVVVAMAVTSSPASSSPVPPPTPVPQDDVAVGTFNKPLSIDVLLNDGISKTSITGLLLKDPTSGASVPSVTIPGVGSYAVVNATVVFTPQGGYYGGAPGLTYQVNTAAGVVQARVQAIIPSPALTPDNARCQYEQPVMIDVSANDSVSGADVTQLALVDPTSGAASQWAGVAQGSYSVSSGKIEFTPVEGYSGPVTPIAYQVSTAGGTLTSLIRVTVDPPQPATPDVTRTASDTAVLVDVVKNDGVAAADVKYLWLLDADNRKTNEVVMAQGVFTVESGQVRFTPTQGFLGAVPAVGYQVLLASGTTMRSTLTVTVDNTAAGAAPTGVQSGAGAATGLVVGDPPTGVTLPEAGA